MDNRPLLTQDEAEAIRSGLEQGHADKVFHDLADYLCRNELKLSDDVLRVFAENELFTCFAGRGQTFADSLIA